MPYWRCSDTLKPETYGRSVASRVNDGSPRRLPIVCSIIQTQNGSLRTVVPSRSIKTARTGRSMATGWTG